MHPIMLADVLEQVACLPHIHSIEDIIIALAKYDASQHGWILGWGYDEGKLKERRAPLKEDLDRASTELPIIVMRTCGHIISVNSKALAIAGITKDTPIHRVDKLIVMKMGNLQAYYVKMHGI